MIEFFEEGGIVDTERKDVIQNQNDDVDNIQQEEEELEQSTSSIFSKSQEMFKSPDLDHIHAFQNTEDVPYGQHPDAAEHQLNQDLRAPTCRKLQ